MTICGKTRQYNISQDRGEQYKATRDNVRQGKIIQYKAGLDNPF